LEGDFKILWSTSPNFEDMKSSLLTDGYLPKGGYIVNAKFIVPESKFGTNYVRFVRPGRDDPMTFPFKVVPSLKVNPSSARPGTLITISGSGFSENDACYIKLDSMPINGNISSNIVGGFTTQFALPDTTGGTHRLSAEATRMYAEIPVTSIIVTPFVILSPDNPAAGSKATISGKGFAANSDVTLKFDGISINNSPSTNSAGSFASELLVPDNPGRDHTLQVKDISGNIVTINLRGDSSPIPLPIPSSPPNPPLGTPAPPRPVNTPVILLPQKPQPITPGEQTFGLFGPQQVTFEWSSVPSINGIVTYTIEISDQANFASEQLEFQKSGLSQPYFTIDLEPGKYFWRVKAVYGSGDESDWALSDNMFRVGMFSIWMLILIGIGSIIALVLIIGSVSPRRKEEDDEDYYY
jgi:hypothetical protein